MPANNTFLNFPQPAIGLAIASKALFSLTSCFSISLTCQCCSNTPSHLRTLVKTLPSWLLGPMFDVFWIFLTCLPCCYLRPTHCFAAQNPQTSSVQGNTPWCCSSHGHPCHKNQLRNDGKWCGYCIDSHSQGSGCPEKVRRAGMKASGHSFEHREVKN